MALEESLVASAPAEPVSAEAPAETAVPALAAEGSDQARRAGLAAGLTWLFSLPVAVAVPSVLHLNPFTQRGGELPLAALFSAALVFVVIALRMRGPLLIGIIAGLFASYVGLVLAAALSGTPLPFEGVGGDTGRLSAMAVRYTVSWATSDGIVADVASEYPPLFPFLVGKTAVLLHVPAWQLVGPAEAVTVSASIVVAFVLWLRLVAPVKALAISALGLAAFGYPSKAYEIIALAAVVPLVLLTASRPSRGRLHWLPAGLMFGVLFLTYYAYLVFVAIGVAALIWTTWRSEEDRRAYVFYLVRIAAVALAVAAWFVIPYAWAMLTGGQQVADMFQSDQIPQNPFPFLSMSVLGLTQLAGLIGMLWYGRTTWWANPLLMIVAGAYAYRAISMVRWVATAHSGLFYYTTPLISTCLFIAAVLTAGEAVPALAERRRRVFSPVAGVAVMTLLIMLVAFSYWSDWMPAKAWNHTDDGAANVDWSTRQLGNQLAAEAHLDYLPDGHRPRYARLAEPGGPVGGLPYLPVTQIQQAVHDVRPGDERPRVLSYGEQLFAYLPWQGYISVDRDASLAPVRWPDRYAELTNLMHITDPAAFAAASAHTRFGPIDVFVLNHQGSGLVWQGLEMPTALRFERSQFAPAHFVVMDLNAKTTVVIRRP